LTVIYILHPRYQGLAQLLFSEEKQEFKGIDKLTQLPNPKLMVWADRIPVSNLLEQHHSSTFQSRYLGILPFPNVIRYTSPRNHRRHKLDHLFCNQRKFHVQLRQRLQAAVGR